MSHAQKPWEDTYLVYFDQTVNWLWLKSSFTPIFHERTLNLQLRILWLVHFHHCIITNIAKTNGLSLISICKKWQNTTYISSFKYKWLKRLTWYLPYYLLLSPLTQSLFHPTCTFWFMFCPYRPKCRNLSSDTICNIPQKPNRKNSSKIIQSQLIKLHTLIS